MDIVTTYMPLIANQNFSGTQPIKWTITSKLTFPSNFSKFDLYGIAPNLAPVGFYNNLKRGDLIKVFSLNVSGDNIDFGKVRLFDNDTDPKSNEFGMRNGDFSNGFTIGSYHQIYTGIKILNQDEDGITSLGQEK